ncbi:TlpA disulfide reductase family protein [Robertkochia solimangrovi]|uniref:TlpA disulfide reductase family protein n=1 Tax=Robertkochia solimangrovi TaxID=2213046 RepID=UPI001180F41E|nr:TlpA disulfide reductase family protein [Robertkochia solimangrovi]TRZ42768.1 TlpA family protein disulfide reductase [Robertkochia solimangrovi]
MKGSKKKRILIDSVLAVLLFLIAFTPIGTPVKVFVNRLISFSPGMVDDDEQQTLQHYDWELRALDGQNLKFASLKGEVVLVNFWATWCPSCIAEMPGMQELYEKYQDRVKFLFVSNEQAPVIQEFLKDKGYTIPVFQSLTAVPDQMISKYIPASFVIAKDGTIVVADDRMARKWNSQKVFEMFDALLQE